jgi:sigma-B regulation protein RsbU (phosphoserine phosphatase)
VVVARSDTASEGERDLREENVRLRGAVLELRLLNDLAREIGASRDSAHVMTTIVRKSMDALHAEQGVLTLLERGVGAPLGRTLVRATASSTDRPAFHVRDAVLGWMVLNKRPLIVNSPEEDERFSGVAWDPSVRSLLCAPLLARSELVGLITVYNKRPAGGFSRSSPPSPRR